MSRSDKDADCRRALYGLVDQGYSIKRIARIAKAMIAEVEEESAERWAAYEMGAGPHPGSAARAGGGQ
jgi:hypothetical protein